MAVYLDPSHYGELIDLYRAGKTWRKAASRSCMITASGTTPLASGGLYATNSGWTSRSNGIPWTCLSGYLLSGCHQRRPHPPRAGAGSRRRKAGKALLRADELGLLARMSPAMEAGLWLAKMLPGPAVDAALLPPEELYLAFLVYRLSPAP